MTAEFAVALPAVLLLLALLLAGASAGVTQLRLEEAARAGARALARGEDAAAVQGIVRTLAGTSATASVGTEGECSALRWPTLWAGRWGNCALDAHGQGHHAERNASCRGQSGVGAGRAPEEAPS
ncbi:hypothetical protein AHiyo4_42280 [Arthrobacter sp. Hiyo4]|nr:hypothetical protein AHiyo4_42280 [Arthrobacter sp. Hiyo4]